MSIVKFLVAGLLLIGSALAPIAAEATTFTLAYDGVGEDTPDITSHGTGTISFDGSGKLTRASLTGFSFTQTVTLDNPSLMGSGTFHYGLSDLLSFDGSFVDGAFSTLDLTTRAAYDPSGFLDDESFQVFLKTGSSGFSASTSFDDGDTATLGTARLISAAPEPGVWVLMIAGLGIIGYALRRHEKLVPQLSYAV